MPPEIQAGVCVGRPRPRSARTRRGSPRDEGCTSPAARATNRSPRNEDPGEVRWRPSGRPASPGLLSPRPAGTRAVSYSEHPLLVRTASLSRVGRRSLRPVLKHGPRSLTCARANGCTKPRGAVKAKGTSGVRGTILLFAGGGAVPALCIDLASCRAARAYPLGPERW